MEENVESLKNMEENLSEYNMTLDSIPWMLQYNKRDLPNSASMELLERTLNTRGVPSYEAVAYDGTGVFATLKAISKEVLNRLT